MARTLGSVLGLSKQTEMLVMTLVTLWVNIFDMTLFEIGNNIEQVWNVPFDVAKFSPQVQHIIKMLLSGVVFVRTFSLHLYIAFLIAMFWPCFLKCLKILLTGLLFLKLHLYAANIAFMIAMFWPCIFGTRPTLMLPWLIVSAVKNIGTGFITFGTGVYTCVIYGPFRPACFRFVGSQILDLGPSVYMWIVGLSLYRDLVKPPSVDKEEIKLTEEKELNVALRRRRVKSMVDDEVLRKQIESQRKYSADSTVQGNENLSFLNIEDTFKIKMSRSLDSLLDTISSQAEIFDVENNATDDECLAVSDQVARLLGISRSEIETIKQSIQMEINSPLYPVKTKKKQMNVANSILQKESPLFLLPKTSMYTPSIKPLRPTKSELKSPNDFLKLKTPSNFMVSLTENENVPRSPDCNLDDKNLQVLSSNHQNIKINNLDNDKTEIWKQESDKFENTLRVFGKKDGFSNLQEVPGREEHQNISFSSKWELYDMKKMSEGTIRDQSERSITSNEKKKSSEEVVAHTDYTDKISDSISSEITSQKPIIKLVTKKVSHEIACQVSTLSKRILDASPKEMSEQLSKESSIDKQSKLNSIKPSSLNSFRSSTHSFKRPISSNSRGSRKSNRSQRDSSYLNIHLHKLELGTAIENLEEDNLENIYRPLEAHRKNFENVTFKF